jgi:hypothetical protein
MKFMHNLYRSTNEVKANNFGLFLIFILCIAFLLSCKTEYEISYFYDDNCSSCQKDGKDQTIAHILVMIEKQNKNVNVKQYNIRDIQNMDVLLKFMEKGKIPVERRHLPILFVNEDSYVGYDEITSYLDRLLEKKD